MPVATKLPAISGTARQGGELETTNGSWTNAPTLYRYAWKKCQAGTCTVMAGKTTATLHIGSHSVGFRLEVVVTATNKVGSTSATSSQTLAVTGRRGR
jgi:hypothetical protein